MNLWVPPTLTWKSDGTTITGGLLCKKSVCLLSTELSTTKPPMRVEELVEFHRVNWRCARVGRLEAVSLLACFAGCLRLPFSLC